MASDQKEHVLEAGDSPGQKPLMSGLSARAELSASTKEESGDGAGPGRAWGVWSRWLRAAKPGEGPRALASSWVVGDELEEPAFGGEKDLL